MTNGTGTMLQTIDARLDTLEVRVAHQDQVIDDLNTVIVAQWSKIDQALGRIARLENRLRDALETAGNDGQDEPPPPHY